MTKSGKDTTTVSRFYDDKYKKYGVKTASLEPWHRETLDVLKRLGNKSDRVLEIGCGNGRLLKALAIEGMRVEGVEGSAGAVELCRKNGLDVRLVDMEDSSCEPFSEPYDFVVSTEVIEHVFDVMRFLHQVNVNLKNGGIAVITTPEFFSLHNRLKLLRGIGPTEGANPTHIRYFTKKYLEDLMSSQGFEIVESFGARAGLFGLATVMEKIHFSFLVKWFYNRFGRTAVVVGKKVKEAKYCDLTRYIAEYHERFYG